MKKLINPRLLSRQLKRLCFVSALVGTANFAASSASGQIVQNGNFESNASSFSGYGVSIINSITDWTTSFGSSGLGGAGITSGSAYQTPYLYNPITDPSVFAYVTNNNGYSSAYHTGSGVYVEQAITLAANTEYTLTFEGASKVRYSAPTSDPATGDILVYDNSGTLADVTITALTPLGADFTQYTANFTTGSDTTGATVELLMTQPVPTRTDAFPYVGDFVEASDVAINPAATTPEPATCGLLALGGAAVLAGRLLRRRAV